MVAVVAGAGAGCRACCAAADQPHCLCRDVHRYHSIEDLDAALAAFGATLAPIPRMALFVAGKAFARYRGIGGVRSGVPAGLFIGAHATVERLPLLTRDARRYRHYFPTVALIAPDGEI